MNTSPLPKVVEAEVVKPKPTPVRLMTFPEAIKKITQEGIKITRKEWNNTDNYGLINGDILFIHRSGKKEINQWIVNLGDILGEDWYVI